MNGEKQVIEEKIEKLIREFRSNPDKFLTEEDVRSYLYHLLLSNYNCIQNGTNGSESIPLHTEIRWYGESGGLNLRSDIVLIDVSTLKTENSGGFKLPSKGYWFNVPKIVIEIKLRRRTTESDKTYLEKIEKDRVKLQTPSSEIGNDFCSFIIIFDKKSDINPPLKKSDNHTEYYVYPYTEGRN